MFVEVEVNGKPHIFMFDTGAAISVIDTSYIRGLKDKRPIGVRDSQGVRAEVQKVGIKEIVIGSSSFNNTLGIATDLGWFPREVNGRKLSGILGSPVTSKANWLFDMTDSTVLITDRPLQSDIMESVRADDQEELHLKITIGNKSEWVEIDTGSGREATFGENSALGAAVEEVDGELVISNRAGVNSQRVDSSRRVEIQDVLLGESTRVDSFTIFVTNSDALRIGTPFFMRFEQFGFDYLNKKLVLSD